MLFDTIFYTLIITSTIGSYKLIKSAKAHNWFFKSLKALLILICAALWIWQLLLWTCPKGNKLEEAIHLPRHLWTLDNVEIVKTVQNEKQLYGAHPRQYYMYYPAPEGSPHKNTVIFYLHGGGWCLGSPDQHRYLGKLLQEQGYSLILPAYRLAPDFSYYDLQEDVNAALKSSLAFLAEQGIQQPKLILGGTSAGGNLASLLAYDEQRWERMGLDRKMLLGVFSIAGVLDLDFMEHTFTLLNYTGPANGKEYQLANPITWISPQDSFQFLCLHGDADGLAAHANAASFCNKLQAILPDVVDFHTFKNTSHIDLGAGWYYNKKANFGQDTVLINWLNNVAKKEVKSQNLL